ncbi:hypothetical protein OG389_10085 [Streptomyces sp. NBC_00435]
MEEVHLAEAARWRAVNPTLSAEEVGEIDEAVALIVETSGS